MAMSCVAKNLSSPIDILDTLSTSTFFHNLNDKLIQSFADTAHLLHHHKGKVIFLQDDEASHFFFIVEGWVKLFRETIDGTEAVIDVLTNGHIFGENSVFEQNIHSFSAECVEPTRLIALPTRQLKHAIETDNQMALNMLTSMSNYRRQQSRDIEHLSLQSAPQRIGCFLLRLCPENSSESISLSLPYDKTLIASRLGMKPETFSRALAKLKTATDIQTAGSTVTIKDIQSLVDFTCSHCSNTVPCTDNS